MTKPTRSSSFGSSKRRRSSSSEKPDSKTGGDDDKGQAAAPLRRSAREPVQPQILSPDMSAASVYAPKSPKSPTSQRPRRRARGLPLPSHSGSGHDHLQDSSLTTPPEAPLHAPSVPTEEAMDVPSSWGEGEATAGEPSILVSKLQRMADDSNGRALTATLEDGKTVSVRVTLNGETFKPHKFLKSGPVPSAGGDDVSLDPVYLGNDGNFYYCVACNKWGDVVCCDGCPHVYHPDCIPRNSESRKSLENDDDPWFCPSCIQKRSAAKKPKKIKSAGKTKSTDAKGNDRRAIKHRCNECHQTRTDLDMEPCKVCGIYIHHPSCRRADEDERTGTSRAVLCSSCRAEAALTEEEFELRERDQQRKEAMERSRRVAVDETISSSQPVEQANGEHNGEKNLRRRTRSFDLQDPAVESAVPELAASIDTDEAMLESPPSNHKRKRDENDDASRDADGKTPGTKKKKKKKKRKHSVLPDEFPSPPLMDPMDEDATGSPSDDPMSFMPQLRSANGQVQAIPAFCFFLAENRVKIERVLARKHRYFNRLPKGMERNQLVTKEGAAWWVKLRPTDQRRFINMSMRDYEARIIQWKEEKNIRDMIVAQDVSGDHGVLDHDSGDANEDEDLFTHEQHDRLYTSTSVGSKPYKPEAGQSHNRVLLDLLRDMRFHPLPMFATTRPETDTMTVNSSKATIPHFDVHGPISTSVGDECLGCTRGWPHFCSVLQRSMPAVEPRSKLQPPLSSLMASRVGLGLRPRLERVVYGDYEDNEGTETESKAHGADLFCWKESDDAKEIKNLRFVPCGTLVEPSKRADDIVRFVEEAVAMKIPEPQKPEPRDKPHHQEQSLKKTLFGTGRGLLPTRQLKKTFDGESDEHNGHDQVNKCGRCRSIIKNDTGCVQCRRAQLVINTAKRLPTLAPGHDPDHKPSKKDDNEGVLLTVQSAMLGRIVIKDNIGETQSEGNKQISQAILEERWAPCAILPPHKVSAPSADKQPDHQSSKSDDVTVDEFSNPGDNTKLVAAGPASGTDEKASVKYIIKDHGEEVSALHEFGQGTDARRNLRRAAALGPVSVFESDGIDRQLAARKHQEEASELSKKTLSTACCGILLALMRRDPLLLFAQPVTAEGYSVVVRRPMDFSKIRRSVLRNAYQTLGAFVADVRLLCDNALIFNPPGSIYWKTAKELLDALAVMKERATMYMTAIKNAHRSYWRKKGERKKIQEFNTAEEGSDAIDPAVDDPFQLLRKTWPGAVEMHENGAWLRKQLSFDFTRTKENETAYYGSLAVRRAAAAAEVCLAPYPHTRGVHGVSIKRTHVEDEDLRQLVDDKVSEIVDSVQLKDISDGREEAIVRLMRHVQSWRLERRVGSENGCARCDGMGLDPDMKVVMNADARWGRNRRKGDGDCIPRVAASRLDLTTGLASSNMRENIEERRGQNADISSGPLNTVCVSLRGSRIHGWGLFAEQPFKKGEVVAEYVGECVSMAVADAREKMYQDMRIQDYQFRLDDSQIIDATMKGGLGRYINHNCNPNCTTKVIPGVPPNQHLRRVIIYAQQEIDPREELTYDYQFPLELDLDARIPCNCMSEVCRGFMNWDLPEKGSNTGTLRTQKRGANMRDRIRRLGRPLKKND